MAQEGSRIRARKTVTLASGATVDIPVITQISFIDLIGDPSAQAVKWAVGQEHQITVDNTLQSGREVHTDQIYGLQGSISGGVITDTIAQTASSIPVERIDTWPIVDPVERGQEFDFKPDNKTINGDPNYGSTTPMEGDPAPSFTTHAKKHVYRYYQNPSNPDDSGIWIDSELIDEIDMIDVPNRGQETHWTLNNPAVGDMSGQADPGDPDITNGTEGFGGNPVRTDPFQNLIGFNDAQAIVVYWPYYRLNDLGGGYPRPLQFKDISLQIVPGFPELPHGFNVSGAPTVGSNAGGGGVWYQWIPPGDTVPGGLDPSFPNPADIVFNGTTSVTGTVSVGTSTIGGTVTPNGSAPFTASISGLSATKDGNPWHVVSTTLYFVASRGPIGSGPAIVFGTFPVGDLRGYDWVVVKAVFKPGSS